MNELSQHLGPLRWAQQQWKRTPRWYSRPSAETRGGRVGPFTRVEGCCDNEIGHSSPLFERGCPKHGRNALPQAGFMLEKCLIFPGDASPAPVSHAVAAEIPCPRNDESAGKRHFVLALHQETAVVCPLVSGSKMQYSTAGDDCYSFFRGRSSQGDKWRMLVGRLATTAPIDQGSERRARPQ